MPSLAEVGLYSPLLLGLYLLAVRSVRSHESGATEAAVETFELIHHGLKRGEK